jgi:hypothetical protein
MNDLKFSTLSAKKKIKLKQQIHERFNSSSLIAFPNILKSEFYYVKNLWTLCLILSVCICSWFIIRYITDYLSNNIITKTIIKNKAMSGLPFPTIGICNLNMFVTEYSKFFLKNYFETEYPEENQHFQALIFSSYADDSIFDRRLFGNNLNDFIFKCTYQNIDCDLEQDFEYYYDVNYGNCFRFNSGRNMKGETVAQKYVYSRGSDNSLDIEFFIGSANNNTNPFSIENGLILFINNESLDSNYHEGINISPGKYSRILLTSYSSKRQPKPYSECTDGLISIDSYNSITYKKTIKAFPNLKYHYITCFTMCYQKYLGMKCDCQSTYYSKSFYESMRKCSVDSNETLSQIDRNCDDSLWTLFCQYDSMIQECDCPIECEYSGYTYIMTSSEYPTLEYSKRLKTENDIIKSKIFNLTYDEIKNSIAKVKIFYDEMIHTDIIEEIKIQMADLISNIGGVLGLFLGNKFICENNF